jgi:acylphosphatase
MTGEVADPGPDRSQTRAHLQVSGRVQGVYFRASAAREAVRLGLTGWVRNLPDGSVEAVAEGQQPALEAFAAWCASGPPAAQVVSVDTRWSAATGEFRAFEVRR